MKIERFIEKEHGRYLKQCGKIVVGVSGGADSMALLFILHAILGPNNLVVAHLDHGWRPDSAQDADYVREIAQSLALPFHAQKLIRNINSTSSLESDGREARYQFLTAVAASENSTTVAVGHHADDQAETLLMHLLRGSGLRGMRGMLFETSIAAWQDFKIIRPLLSLTKKQIEAYCEAINIRTLADPTNNDDRFLRNKIRHQLLPRLQTIQPDISSHLSQLAHIVAADYSLINQVEAETWPNILVEQKEGWLRLHKGRWQELPLSLQRGILRTAVSQLIPTQSEIGFQAIEKARLGAARGYCGSHYSLPHAVQLIVEHESLLLKTQTAAVTIDQPLVEAAIPVELPLEGQVRLKSDWVLQIRPVHLPNLAQIRLNENLFEAFILPMERLYLRNRLPGERIQPLGMNGRSRKLKKVMIEHHIPKELRASWPIVANDSHIIWLVGHQLDHRARLQAGEQEALHLICEKLT